MVMETHRMVQKMGEFQLLIFEIGLFENTF